jgi:hypothetical protein
VPDRCLRRDGEPDLVLDDAQVRDHVLYERLAIAAR